MAASKPVNETGVVLIGGYCGSRASYEEFRAGIQRQTGQRTLYIGSCRWGRVTVRGKAAYPRPLYRQAIHAAYLMQRAGIKRARVFGHSMGGAVALILATEFPDLVEDVVLLAPACLYKERVLTLYRRAFIKGLQDRRTARSHANRTVRRLMRRRHPGVALYMSNLWRAAAEGAALARFEAFKLLYPRLQKAHIRVTVACATDDTLFPLKAALNALEQTPQVPVITLPNVLHDVQCMPGTVIAQLRAQHVL